MPNFDIADYELDSLIDNLSNELIPSTSPSSLSSSEILEEITDLSKILKCR